VDLVLLAAIVGITSVCGFALRRPTRRDLARLRVAKVTADPSAVPEGSEVVVRGAVSLVDPGADLSSPISRRQCIYWLVTFDELGIGNDFVELGRSEQGRPFLLRYEDRIARIVPEHIRTAVPGSVTLYAMRDLDNSWYNDAGIRLARSVCKRPNYPDSSSLRVTEYVVTPEMHVTVQGYCTHEPDPAGAEDVTGYRADVPMRPVISGTKRSPLLLADYKRVSDDGQ
jgi:hypothetical protein